LLSSILLGSVALWLQQRIRTPASHGVKTHGLWAAFSHSDPQLRLLLFSDILIRFCERIPFAWVVIYAMNNLGMSASAVGVLIAIEMAAAIVCYVPACWLADRYGKEPFVLVTFGIFTAFPIVLSIASGFSMLAVAFVVRGLKEFGEPARKALILAYAAEGAKGQAVGAYYLVRDTVVSAAALLGAFLWNIGPHFNFCGAAVMGIAGTISYLVIVRKARAHRLVLQR
jgi:MFS family permease